MQTTTTRMEVMATMSFLATNDPSIGAFRMERLAVAAMVTRVE
jgi:hypothetical protein